MPDVLQEFSFVDRGRTFQCRVAASRVTGPDPWWWFEISTEQHQRHAPFRADPDDTLDVVQQRMVAYYDNLLERRAAPVVKKWSRPAPQATAVAGGEESSDVIEMDAETEEVVAEIEEEIAELPGEDEDAPAA
ncbi:hypothetical protein [Gemmatimonas sp.]|uniref:hypothetical protein n=1 Tax=Gemmatimonas sp. TaxID=1962908 RepID=UPI00356A14B0